MAKSVNKVTLLGNVGRVEKMEGKQITTLSIATSEDGYTKKDGTKVEEKTYWHRCVAFGKLADIVAQYVQKGNKLYVEGKLTYNDYEKDGQKRQSTDIVIEDITFIGGKSDNQQTSQPHMQTRDEDANDGLPF